MVRRFSEIWRKLVMALALATVLCGPVVGAAARADGVGDVSSGATRSGRILGIQPTVGSIDTSLPFLGSGNLTYHGGETEKTNKVYAIYWVPSGYTVSANYKSLIGQFFTDVAHDSGLKNVNVYNTDTDYYSIISSLTVRIKYRSTFGGSVTDTNALPTSGCHDSYTSVCVTDAQIKAEINRVVAAQGWTANSTTEFFLFTAKGIGSCFDSGSSECAFSQYCAYHSWIGGGSSATLYANMPYADTVSHNCDVGQHPNNDDADATINVASHEHNETITDEQGNAWYDAFGYEDGDKCAWIFGPVSGPAGQEYNQTINSHHYFLQEEWSNKNGCVQKGK